MTLQPLPDISRLPQLPSGSPIELLSELLSDTIPPEIRSILTGFLTDGLIGGLDVVVFNNLPELPESLQGLAGSLYEQLSSGSFDISSTAKSVLDTFVMDRSPEAIKSLYESGLSIINGGSLDPVSILNGLGGTTQLLQQFGTFAEFAIPGMNVVKTASTIMSVLGLKTDLPFLGGQGLGITGAIGALGSPANLISNLVAPSALKLFGGLFGGGSQDPRKTCPCLEICRKTDHFITEDSTNLLKTCAPVLNSSISSSESSNALSSLF